MSIGHLYAFFAKMQKKVFCHLLITLFGFFPWVGKIPWRREWLPTPVFLPGEFHGQRNLTGYSPWSHKESDTTEQLSLSILLLAFLTFWYFNIFMTGYIFGALTPHWSYHWQNIFSHSMGCLFIFSTVSCAMLSLIRFHLPIFAFVYFALGDSSRKYR